MCGLDEEESARIKQQFRHLHPLFVQRSIERAKDKQELSDILSSVASDVSYPMCWDNIHRRWTVTRLIAPIEE